MFTRFLTTPLLLFGLLLVAACDTNDPGEVESRTIAQLAGDTPALSTLASAVVAADLDDDLSAAGPFTVFAPSNAAFEAVQGDLLQALLNDREQLTDLLTYHVVAGAVRAENLTDGQVLTTLQGDPLTVTVEGNAVFVNGVRVSTSNVEASNGVVHVIDGVLVDPIDIVDAASLLGLTQLTAAAAATGLVPALQGDGPLTVFAPTNSAFAAANAGSLTESQVRNILLYHVTDAGAVTSDALSDNQTIPTLLANQTLGVDLSTGVQIEGDASTAQVTMPDIVVGNGVIHVIDAVLLPDSF